MSSFRTDMLDPLGQHFIDLQEQERKKDESNKRKWLLQYYPRLDQDKVKTLPYHDLQLVVERLETLQRENRADRLITYLQKN